ncbi:ABC transporter permease [Vibrio tapetis]|uniref:ABC-type antimicrobial peptide transport system, permease component n=1 Tax=Vibrio tapetis subsp. tapetis TaxID=1671868 RepID=A0A2N8Z8S7_9VIBR|nr:ABC transporter permease [Vibrio tapetis]SON48296.1 conserved membrane protein of unknown function [Vibrio tapetis subsp. tapetis]
MISVLQQTLQTLLAHRLRSVLAVIAIVWGIVSVLVLVALGEGFYQVNSKSFSMLMNNTQLAFVEQTSKEWQGLPARRELRISKPQLEMLAEQPVVQSVSAVYGKWDATVTDTVGAPMPGNVSGIDDNYIALRNLKLAVGSRAISPTDVINHTKVAILGWRLALMGNVNLGDNVNVNGIPFVVVGVTEQSEGFFQMGNEDDQVMIPSTTFQDLWQSPPFMLIIEPSESVLGSILRTSVRSFFAAKQHFDPSDQNAIYMPDIGQETQFFSAILRGIQLFLGASGAMTLAVGTIGVANIMFLSVTERTREIGVRLAIGATPRNILSQFLLEGGILVVVGTILGMVFSYAIVFVLNLIGMPEWLGQPTITGGSIAMSLLVTFILALLAAYFPARRAANLTPVQALVARA